MKIIKVKLVVACLIVFLMHLYCLAIILIKGPTIGIVLTQSQDNIWQIQNVQENSWGYYQNLEQNTHVLKINGVKLQNVSSPFIIKEATSLTILDEGQEQTLTVSYSKMTSHFIKQFLIPLIYVLLIGLLCMYLLSRPPTNSKYYLVLHLQFTALAYSSAGAAGGGDYIAIVINSLAIFLSLMYCIYYCNYYLRNVGDILQKKLSILFVVLGITLLFLNISRFLLPELLGLQIIIELSIYLAMSCLLVLIIIKSRKFKDNKAKSLFFIFFLGIGPFFLFYSVPILLNSEPILPADVTALFLLIIPICLIHLEFTEKLFDLQYALDKMLSHLSLSIPFSLVLSFLLVLVMEVPSFILYSIYFLIFFSSLILLLSFKEWIEVKNARYIKTLKDYNFNDFYFFIKSTSKYSSYNTLIEYTKKELNLMLKLHSIEIIDEDLIQHLRFIEANNYRTICSGLIYQNEEKYILVLHETLEMKLIAIIDTSFKKIPPEALKMLELFLYYVHSIIDNSLKMDHLMAKLTSFDRLYSPRWYSKLWILSTEQERFRLSTDIHDTILQDLIRLSRNIEDSTKAGIKGFMLLREEVLDIIDATRDICENLYPPMIERLGLYMSLGTLFEKYKVRYNFIIKDDIEKIDGLSLDQATAIYRIIQELLTNASKHSEAYVIHIVLKKQNQIIYIEYIDDGVGIDKNISLDEIKSLGLIGIHERVNYYKGIFEIYPNCPQGTAIKISMKVDESYENNGFG